MPAIRPAGSVWVALIARPPTCARSLLRRCFSPAEHEEYVRLPARRRDGWLTSRLAVKTAYRRARAGGCMRHVVVRHDQSGRPLLFGQPGWRCSLAHSGGGGAGVVARVPVGLDLERVDGHGWGVVRTVATEREVELVAEVGMPGAYVPSVLWTVKEAVLKGAGVGLALHPRRAVIAERRPHDCIVRLPQAFAEETTWSVISVIRRGWAMAIARPLVFRAGLDTDT